MSATALYIYGLAMSLEADKRFFHMVSFAICAFASLAYLVMAFDLGRVEVDGRDVFYARYIDWAVTTPLLLVDLGFLAGMSAADVAGLCVWDVLMIAGGLFGALTTHVAAKYSFFAYGCVAFLFIVRSLYAACGLAKEKRSPAVAARYNDLAMLTILVWFAYPIVWVLGEGGGFVSIDVEIILYAILDVTAKVVFSLLLVSVRPEEHMKEEERLVGRA